MRLTTSGTVFAIGGVALIVAAYRFGVPAFLPAGLLLLALVVFSLLAALALGSRVRAGIRVSAPDVDGTPVVRAGSTVHMRARLHNPLPFGTGAFTVTLHSAPGFGPDQRARIPALAARSAAVVDADFTPIRRGLTGLSRLSTEFAGPFGLAVRRVTIGPGVQVAVAPAQLHAPGTAPGQEPDPAAAPRTSRGAGGRDFETRPYVPGDDLRHVHWASTARLGELMLRSEAKETSPRLDIVIDLRADSDQAEALLAAVAAAARAASADGAIVSVSAHGKSAVPPPGDEAELDLFLAQVQPGEPAQPDGALRPSGGFAVIATDDPEPREAAARLLAPGVRARVWDVSMLRDATITPERLADGLVADLPWRMEDRWLA